LESDYHPAMSDRKELVDLVRSDPAQAVARCTQVIEHPASSASDRIYARIRLARAYSLLGDVAKGTELADVARVEAQQVGDGSLVALALSECGVQAYLRDEFLQSLQWHEEAIEQAKTVSMSDTDQARLFVNMANALTRLNANVEAIEMYDHALGIARESGDKQLTATLLGNLAILMRTVGAKPDVEHAYLEEALAIFRSLGDTVGETNAMSSLASYYKAEGNLELAKATYQEIVDRCQSESIPVFDSVLFHMTLTCSVLGHVTEAKMWLETFANKRSAHVGWEYDTLLALATGTVALAEGNLADCVAQYEIACNMYFDHDHHAQVESVIVELLPRLEECKDYAKLCKYYRMLQHVRRQSRVNESQHSLAVLATNHERERMRQAAEIDRLQNIELAKAHGDLVRSAFVLDRLVENCAVRLSMPLDMIRDLIEATPEATSKRPILEEVQGVIDLLLNDVVDILQNGQQDLGQASLQTLQGVMEFVRSEVEDRLSRKSWTSQWVVQLDTAEAISINAARFHSLVMRVLDVFQVAMMGSVSLEVKVSMSSDNIVELSIQGRGKLALSLNNVRTATADRQEAAMPTTTAARSLRMAWLGVEYAVERLKSANVIAHCGQDVIQVAISIPVHNEDHTVARERLGPP
jgi:tetratricopeptide (TPR) repeat protein